MSESAQQGGNGGPPTRAVALHAPWRLSYMEMLGKARREGERAKNPGRSPRASGEGRDGGEVVGGCFLREYWLKPERDEANHVIVRTGIEEMGRGGLILLNKYPYANGHLLVALGVGRSRLLDYDEAQRSELWSLVDLAVDLVERTLAPQGVNVGFNQGSAAGAGVPEHVHGHVVPRWAGDVNFMTVCANIRVIPGALEEMAKRYREVWEEVRGER